MRLHGEGELRYTIEPLLFAAYRILYSENTVTVGRLTLGETDLVPDHSSLDSSERLQDGYILQSPSS